MTDNISAAEKAWGEMYPQIFCKRGKAFWQALADLPMDAKIAMDDAAHAGIQKVIAEARSLAIDDAKEAVAEILNTLPNTAAKIAVRLEALKEAK